MEQAGEKIKKKCVGIDTNIWVYDSYLLRTPMGVSLLFHIKLGDMVIGLPEVVELEIFKHSQKIGLQAIEDIKKNLDTIEILLGERDEYKLPIEEQITESVKQRLNSLETSILRIPFNFEQAKGALYKILDEIPPNHEKNQQFKDSVIWETILELCEDYDVFFITKDKGFFEKRDTRNGLASTLKKEIDQLGVVVNLYDSINAFLNGTKKEIQQLDQNNLKENLKASIIERLQNDNNYKDTIVKDMIDSSLSLFLTEQPYIMTVSFNMKFSAVNSVNDNEFLLEAIGECSYNFQDDSVSHLWFDSLTLPNGGKIVYVSGIASSRRKIKKYSIKSPLL